MKWLSATKRFVTWAENLERNKFLALCAAYPTIVASVYLGEPLMGFIFANGAAYTTLKILPRFSE